MTSRPVVTFFTGTRAEYGLLRPLILEAQNSVHLTCRVIVSGTHLSEGHGSTVDAILADGVRVDARVPLDLSSDDAVALARASAQCLAGTAQALRDTATGLLVLLGDRYELLAAANAATLMRIPVAHIHGGERTEGAMDDAMRHAITKLSHLHFVSTAAFGDRVAQLGEERPRIHVVGALGLDAIRTLTPMDVPELEASLGVPLANRVRILVTLHPETLTPDHAGAHVTALLGALDAPPDATLVFTGANADPEGHIINTHLQAYAARHKDRAVFLHSLGQRRYLSMLRAAHVVVGNSSSGVLEAPAVGTPTVDIGTRQAGRPRGPLVLGATFTQQSILEAVNTALSDATQARRVPSTLYGDGHAATRILSVLESTSPATLLHKRFVDILPDPRVG